MEITPGPIMQNEDLNFLHSVYTTEPDKPYLRQ